jgi:hypothetical protein
MRKVFISHAARDKELADLVENLIETGIGVSHHEVFCTSLEGLGIPEGTPDFKEYIRKELDGCDSVVALISENYYASSFCMCELGAVWVLAKNFFPILVPPVDFADLRGALTGMQCRKLTDQTTPSALYDHLSKVIPNPVPVARWDIKKESFVRSLPKILSKIPKPEVVKAGEHARVIEESKQYKEAAVQLQEENDSLRKQIDEIAKTKDAKAVSAIRKKYSSESEQFDGLLNSCSEALSAVPRVVSEALYYWTRNEPFAPEYQQWGDAVKLAIENDELTEGSLNDYQFWPNEERPKIKRAMKEIDALRHFLEEESSEEFCKDAIAELGDTPDLRRRSFWEKYLW